MSIKYAEITIIRNFDEESIFQSVTRYFGYLPLINDNDDIILTFDDGVNCDVKKEYIDKKYKFSISSWVNGFPIYFDFNKKYKLAFYKNPNILESGQLKLDFRNIFKNYPKYNQLKHEPCNYNMIYKDNNNEIFAILRIRSSNEKPRYLLAFDESNFDRSDVIYLTEIMFKCKFKTKNENETEKNKLVI